MPEASLAAGVPIGGAVADASWHLLDKYVPKEFTSLTPSNDMKWRRLLHDENILGVYNFTKADRVVDFAISAGVQLRGHTLLFTPNRGQHYPMEVALQVEASDDPESAIKHIMREHIQAVTQHFGDKVAVWDVVNEHMRARKDDNIFYTTLGDDYVKLAFQLAREVLPNTPLVWNEAMLNFSPTFSSNVDWLKLLKQYKEEGVPIDRIGFQGHQISTLHDIPAVRALLQTVADLGYDIEITEFDVPLGKFPSSGFFFDPFQAQADYYAAYQRACLDTGRCKGFTTWGLSDEYSWLDRQFFSTSAPNHPLLLDVEGISKPAWLSIRRELEAYAGQQFFLDGFLDMLAKFWGSSSAGIVNGWAFIASLPAFIASLPGLILSIPSLLF